MPRQASYPAIFKFEEKYGDEIYIVQSEDEVNRVAVAKIRERYAEGWYIKASDYEDELNRALDRLIKEHDLDFEKAPRTLEALHELKGDDDQASVAALFGMDVDILKALPAPMREKLVEKAKSFVKKFSSTIRNYSAEIEDARDIELIAHSERAQDLQKEYRGRTTNLARWILNSRKDHEYENYEIDQPQLAPTEEQIEAGRL